MNGQMNVPRPARGDLFRSCQDAASALAVAIESLDSLGRRDSNSLDPYLTAYRRASRKAHLYDVILMMRKGATR